MFNTFCLIIFIAFHLVVAFMIAGTIKDIWKEIRPYLNYPFISPSTRAEYQFFDHAEELRKLYEKAELDMRYPNRLEVQDKRSFLEKLIGVPPVDYSQYED